QQPEPAGAEVVAAGQISAADRFPAERKEREAAQHEARAHPRDAHDRDEHDQPGEPPRKAHEEAAEDEPEEVADGAHQYGRSLASMPDPPPVIRAASPRHGHGSRTRRDAAEKHFVGPHALPMLRFIDAGRSW